MLSLHQMFILFWFAFCIGSLVIMYKPPSKEEMQKMIEENRSIFDPEERKK